MIKKYFLFIPFLKTYQVFSKAFYRNLENNLNTNVAQTSFWKLHSNIFSICIYFDIANHIKQVRYNSFFSYFNHFSIKSSELIRVKLIGLNTHLMNGIRA